MILPNSFCCFRRRLLDLGHQVCGEAQLLQSLLQDLGGVPRLAAITL